VTVNQYFSTNRYRRFPFVQDAPIPFTDEVLVDAQFCLSTQFNLYDGGSVVLTQLVRGAGLTVLTFTINSGTATGYTLTGSAPDNASDTRILLTLLDPTSVPAPEHGYGFCTIGSAASLVGLGGTTTMSATIDPAATRLIDASRPLSLVVCNANIPGPSTCGETPGSSTTLVSGVVRTQIGTPWCFDYTDLPTIDINQTFVDSLGNISQIPIPSPIGTYLHWIATTQTYQVVASNLTITDAIPPLPTTYQAVAVGAPCVAGAVATGGHNVDLSGSIQNGILQFNYRLGGGTGYDCNAVPLGTPIVSLNGVCTFDGLMTLAGGTSTMVVEDAANHTIIIVFNPEEAGRVGT
jgi:hypothetical protein